MTERENILAKIKKMLTLARRATNENEAAQAASVAHKFMERYNLCITEVEGISLDDSEIVSEEAHRSGRLATWKLSLITHVSRVFNCRILIHSGYRKRSLDLVGTKSDIEVARLTFEYLVSAVEKFAKKNAAGSGRSYITSYKVGLVQRLGERLREQARENRSEVEEVATSTGRELAVVKDANLKEFMGKFKGRYRTPQSDLNYSAYQRGQNDGNDIGINKQITGSKRNHLT
tara:strand:- start:707 stop:1402 length:696 start_codon:yes stop_codon:yes gene_type:complete